MKSEKSKRSGNGPNRLMSQLAVEKKKAVIALCLITIMAFMWIRVLGGKTPQAAEAEPTGREVTGEQSNSKLKISFIELPNVKGRNDVLNRDFFTVNSWQEFLRDGQGRRLGDIEEVNVVSRNGSEEIARRIAEKLKLEAIELGENPLCFINNKLLSVGDKLLVRDGVNAYECEVIGIEETEVFIRYADSEIRLKLTQAIEIAD